MKIKRINPATPQGAGGRAFHRGRVGVTLVALLLGLALAGSGHSQPPAATPDEALWVAGVNGLVRVSLVDGAVLLRIRDPKPVRLVAVDDATGHVWAFATNTLVAFDASGQRLLEVPVPPAPLTSLFHQALAVDPATGAVWLALARQLHRFDTAGRRLGTVGLPDFVQGLAVDPAGARLWVATRSSVAPYDAGGHRGPALDLGGRRDVESLAIDHASGDLWIGLRDGLRRHQAGGALLFEVPIGGLEHLADDGAGGLWTATLNRLRRLDPSGHVLVEHRAFADGIVITAIAPDPADHSVWVSGLLTLRHVGAAGQRLAGPTMPGLILDLALFRLAGPDANEPPVARDDAATTAEGTPVTIPVLANDADPDGDSLAVTAVTPATRGTVTIGPGGLDVTYTPAPNTSGADAFTYTVGDGRGGTATASVAVTVTPVNDPPVAIDDAATTPEDTPVTITVLGNDTDPDGDALTVAGVTQGTHGAVAFGPTTVTYSPNAHVHGADSFTYTARDPAGATATATVRITVTPINDAPAVSLAADPAAGPVPLAVVFTATASDADGDALTHAWDFGDGTILPAGGATESHTYRTPGSFTARVSVSDGQASATASVVVTPAGLPDPAAVAPPLPLTETTSFAAATEFLYSGPNALQTGVAPGAIDARRAAVLRGRVLDRAGAALAGVQLGVLGHPELGRTFSRTDGMFDLAVNGGGTVTLTYARDGFLSAQRSLDVPWQDFTLAPDVVLIPADPVVTPVDLTAAVPIQVARGSVSTDADGSRQATLLFRQGTQATMVLPGGTTQPLTHLGVRATEYTVGPSGPAAMPAVLPPTSGYTYAVELGVDEAVAAGATAVRFDRPVPLYVENFLGFPVGGIVPVGSYDRDKGAWLAERNGRIVQVLAVSGGLADLDVTGDGIADTGAALADLGVDDAERAVLATLYAPGTGLWRVPVSHFSPYDLNWAIGPPRDARFPQENRSQLARDTRSPDDPCAHTGSVIWCESQGLGESLALAGTPYRLHYASDRVPGRTETYLIEIPLTVKEPPPASLRRVELEVQLAGQVFSATYDAAPGLVHTLVWNGRDAYGRSLQGEQRYRVTITYVYPARYILPGLSDFSFPLPPSEPFAGAQDFIGRVEYRFPQRYEGTIGTWPIRPGTGLAGWSLSHQHQYDPAGGVLYLGTGEQKRASTVGRTVTSLFDQSRTGATLGDSALEIFEVAAAPDGTVYFVDDSPCRIRQITPSGVVAPFAGVGFRGGPGGIEALCDGSPADGIPATQANFAVGGIAVGPDGSVYVLDQAHSTIRRIGRDGLISTVAGNGIAGSTGDGGPALAAAISPGNAAAGRASPAIGPDGTIYFAERHRIRRIGPEGIIHTIAGTGGAGGSGDGGPAVLATVTPLSLAIGPDGSIFFTQDRGSGFPYRLRRITPDGVVQTVAGLGPECELPEPTSFGCGDGGPAEQAFFFRLSNLAVGPDGSIFLVDQDLIRQIGPEGVINTAAGVHRHLNSTVVYAGDGRQAGATLLFPWGVAVAPDNALIVSSQGGVGSGAAARHINAVRRLALPSALTTTELTVPGPDGQIHVFTRTGRHLRTVHGLTGAVLRQFQYDQAGRLVLVTEMTGGIDQSTAIERDGDGNPLAIVGPFGHRTVLAMDANGYLAAVTNPAGETTRLVHDAGGLLTQLVDPRGGMHRFAYDPQGRLIRDEAPDGGAVTLGLSLGDRTATVSVTTAEGRVTTYRTELLANGDRLRVITRPSGARTTVLRQANGTTTTTAADGSVRAVVEGPDPRWGMLAPVALRETLRLPSGLTRTTTSERAVTLADPTDVFAIDTMSDATTVNGRRTTRVYTGSTRTLVITTPAGRRATAVLDVLGRVGSQQVGDLTPVLITYDSHGRTATVSQSGRTMTFGYGPDGDLASLTDALGRTSTYARDAAGRITSQTRPDGTVVGFGYDQNGNLIRLTPPGRPDHAFAYTPRDLTESYTAAGAAVTGYVYDRDRRLTREVRPDGVLIDLGYDAAGRLSSRATGTGSTPFGSTTFGYDAADRLARLTAPGDASLAFAHDAFLVTEDVFTSVEFVATVGRTYDASFRLASRSLDGDTIGRALDADDLLIGEGALTLTRSAQHGLITSTTLGVVTTTLARDGFGDVVHTSAAASGSPLYATSYVRDDLGRLTSLDETIDGVTTTFGYRYDAAGRLIEVRRTTEAGEESIEAYEYDANGNRTGATVSGVGVIATYDDQDRVLTYGDATFAHTDAGERLFKTVGGQTTYYSYDALGNLVAVTLPGGSQIDYSPDGRDRRFGKLVDGARVQGFVYQDQLRPIAELDGGGNLVSRFVYATNINVPAYMVRDGVTYRILTDHRGSVRLAVNATSGEVVQRMDYDSFGNVLRDTNPGFQPFGFAGGLYDRDTGLVRFGARDYDPETGRWTTKDPIGFAGGDANLYRYAGNDPINVTDPSGLACHNDLLEELRARARRADDLREQAQSERELGDFDLEFARSAFRAGQYATSSEYLGRAAEHYASAAGHEAEAAAYDAIGGILD